MILITSDGADEALQFDVTHVAFEQNVRHVRVDVLVIAAGAVDDGRKCDL